MGVHEKASKKLRKNKLYQWGYTGKNQVKNK